jgi:long-chain fatty acid transport protein
LIANLTDLGINPLDGFTVGLGVTSPFGTLTDYPNDAPFSTVATFAALPLLDIKPTFGFKLNEYLSIGAGVDVYTFASFIGEGQAEAKQIAGPEFGSAPLSDLGISPGEELEFNGTDTAVGFNVGLLFTPLRNADGDPRFNLAFVYRNQVTLDLEGELRANGQRVSDASAKLKLPQVFTGGLAFWPMRDIQREWKLEVDLEYADWSSFDDLDLQLSNGVVLPQPRDWKGGFVVAVGTEYKWLHLPSLPDWEVAVRGSYVRSETPVPERTFHPNVPDSDYNAISVGVGFFCKRGMFLGLIKCRNGDEERSATTGIGLDLAYQVAFYESRTIRNNIHPIINGTWDTIVHIGAINLRFNF